MQLGARSTKIYCSSRIQPRNLESVYVSSLLQKNIIVMAEKYYTQCHFQLLRVTWRDRFQVNSEYQQLRSAVKCEVMCRMNSILHKFKETCQFLLSTFLFWIVKWVFIEHGNVEFRYTSLSCFCKGPVLHT
jgi:hypothetical protein